MIQLLINFQQAQQTQNQKVNSEFSIQQLDIFDINQLKCLTPAFYDKKQETLFLSNRHQLMTFLSNQMIKVESDQNVQQIDQNNQQHEFSNQISGLLNLVDSANFPKYVPCVFANQQQPIQQEKKSQFNIPGVQIEQTNSEKVLKNRLPFFSSKLIAQKNIVSMEQEENNQQIKNCK